MKGDEGTYPFVTRFGSHRGGLSYASQPPLSETQMNVGLEWHRLRKYRDFQIR